MVDYTSIQMTPPTYPVSGPVGDGRTSQHAIGNFTVNVAANVNDRIIMCKLHPNFRVLGGFLKTSGLGAGVNLQVGDAANTSRYFAAASAATAGTRTDLADTGRDYINTGAFTPVFITVTGATTATGGTITLSLTGVIENPL